MIFLFKLVLPFILVSVFRSGRPFLGTNPTRFLIDLFLVFAGWGVLFQQ